MTKYPDETTNIRTAVKLVLKIEESEPIVAPGLATSRGAALGVLVNHKETWVTEELEEKNATPVVIIGNPFIGLRH